MSRPASKVLQVWECPNCQGKFKVDHWQRSRLPQHLERKWSSCPWGFSFGRIEWVCPFCQQFVSPGKRYVDGRRENSWNAIFIYEEGKPDAKETWKAEWDSLPYVVLKSGSEILSTGTYPSEIERSLRLYRWQELGISSYEYLTEIDQQKKAFLKNPFQYFYCLLLIKMGRTSASQMFDEKFQQVQRLVQDEIELKKLNAHDEQESKSNMHRLLDLLNNGFDKAEVYRHLGMFDECIKTLQAIDTEDQFESDLKKEMLKRANRKDARIFKIEDGLDAERVKHYMR